MASPRKQNLRFTYAASCWHTPIPNLRLPTLRLAMTLKYKVQCTDIHTMKVRRKEWEGRERGMEGGKNQIELFVSMQNHSIRKIKYQEYLTTQNMHAVMAASSQGTCMTIWRIAGSFAVIGTYLATGIIHEAQLTLPACWIYDTQKYVITTVCVHIA